MYKIFIAVCAMISGAVIFYACSETPSDNDSADNGSEEPTEFSADITSPANGDILKGVVTITAEAEASGGIEEVRFFLGDDLLFSADSSPFEYEIDTREYSNGTQEIRIEAAMADSDSVITETVPVELENYMVELETENIVANFNNEHSNDWITDSGLYLFISAPDGRVLAEEELTQDGPLQLLPPEALSDGAPENYQLTIARFSANTEGYETLNLTTETALESWAPFSMKAAASSENIRSPREVGVELTNIQNDPIGFMFLGSLSMHLAPYDFAGPFQGTATVEENQDHLILTSIPSQPPYEEGMIPHYYWEKNLENASSVNYDVEEQFEKMSEHSVSYPSGIQPSSFVNFSMSIEQDSWEAGAVFFPGSFFSRATTSEVSMFVPISNHQYQTDLSGFNASASDIRYTQRVRGALPSSFETLNAEATVSSSSLDDVQFRVSGTADFVILRARAGAETFQNNWTVHLADSTTAFVFPEIEGDLDSKITHYNRSELQLVELTVMDFATIDGYEEYREYRISGEAGSLNGYQAVTKLLNTGQQKRETEEMDQDFKSDRNQKNLSFNPQYRLIKH